MSFPELEMILDSAVPWRKQDFVRQYEAKLMGNQPALRNLITGIDPPSREAMEKIIASVQTLALDCSPITVLDHYSVRPAIGARALLYLATAEMIAAFASALPKETLSLTAEAVSQANRINFNRLGAMTGSAALAALDFSEFTHHRGHIETFQTSYSGRLAATLRDVLNESEITDESVLPLENLIKTRVALLPQNRVSAEGMFTLLLTLLAVITSYETHPRYFSSTDSALATAQSRHLSHIVRGVLEATQRLIPQTDNNIYYRVMRQVGVSARPKPRPYQLSGLLVPEQTVRLVERSHKWISVEYFDQLHGVARQGWAQKKYFEQVSAAAAQPARERIPQISNAATNQAQAAIKEDWEESNKRRIDLIYKKAESSLTNDERIELDRLQHLADERLHLLAPLPISSLEALLEKLERRT